MSLINDMLRDLEPESESALESQSSAADRSPPQKKLISFKKYLLPILALLAGVYFVVFELNLFHLKSKATAPIEIPKPIAMNSKWLNVNENPAKDDNSGGAENTPMSNTAQKAIPVESHIEIEVDLNESELDPTQYQETVIKHVDPHSDHPDDFGGAISRLLDEAKRALTNDQLMTPAKHNAYQLYNSVLLLDPENLGAKQGLRAIRSRYIEMAKNAEARGLTARAQGYLKRAKIIGPWQDELTLDVPSNNNPSPHSIDQTSRAQIQETKRVSDPQLANKIQHQFSTSLKQLAFNKMSAGEMMPLTGLALADVFTQAQDLAQLRQLEQAIADQQPSLKVYVNVQAMVVQGEFERARELLSQSNFNGVIKIPALRLLSAVCQKLGDLQCAERGYEAIVKSGEVQVSDWLGLAVCLDRLNRSGDALIAYQQIEKYHYQNAQVERFVRQRIADLSSYSYRR